MHFGINSTNLGWFVDPNFDMKRLNKAPAESYYLGVALIDPNEGDLY